MKRVPNLPAPEAQKGRVLRGLHNSERCGKECLTFFTQGDDREKKLFCVCVCDRKIACYLNPPQFSGMLGFPVFFPPFSLIQGLLVSQSELSQRVTNTETHWYVYINIQKYVLPVHLKTTCERKRMAFPKAPHSCRSRCLRLWDRMQLLSPLYFLLRLLQDNVSIFSAVLQHEPYPMRDLRRYKVEKKSGFSFGWPCKSVILLLLCK